MTAPDHSPLLGPKQTKHIQSISVTFLYYGRAIDSTILPILNDISSQHTQPTEQIKETTQGLMDYVTTFPTAYIRYYTSDMVLYIDSNAAYLVAPKSRSRVAGYYHL